MDLCKLVLLINTKAQILRNYILFLFCQIGTFSSLVVLSGNCNFEIVKVFSRIHGKAWLICFIRYTIPNSWTKHELWTLHIVIHAIFKCGHKSFFIYFVEIYFFICGNLDSDISFDEINLTSHVVEFFILLPEVCFFIFFEKQNATGRSYNKSLIKEKIHCSQIWVGNLLDRALTRRKRIDSEAVSLTVESGTVLGNWWIEWFYWEISNRAWWILDFSHNWVADRFLFFERVQEMILSFLHSMVTLNKKIIILNKTACDQWLPETRNWFRLIIERQKLWDVQVIKFFA